MVEFPAGSVGEIAREGVGSETREPVPTADVIVEGTTLEAADVEDF